MIKYKNLTNPKYSVLQDVQNSNGKQYITKYSSPVGIITLASDGQNIIGLWIKGQKYFESTLDNPVQGTELPIFDKAKEWLDDYFDGNNPPMKLPLLPKGSGFRKSVWEILMTIPYGETITYGEIAKRLEKKSAGKQVCAQAVGGAVGHNPISIIIPCHRVVGSNGSLTGYAGGLDKKISLLKLEKADMKKLFVPKEKGMER